MPLLAKVMKRPLMYKMYVNGEWVDSDSKETFDVINPATETVLAKVPKGSAEDARAAVDAARDAFDSGPWPRMTPAERSSFLLKLADMLEQAIDRFAKLEAMNVGKTFRYARESDYPFTVDNLRFFAGAARVLEGKSAAEYADYHENGAHKPLGMSILRREPIGVVGAIVPWNYPLYIAAWKFAPALTAGNTLVIKPATYTPLTTLEFAKLVEKAGVPKGVFNVVTGPGEVVGAELASSEKVDMIAMTGDTATGKKIMQMAASNVKKVHLELGGKAPLVILQDADLKAAAEGAVVGGFWNTGQDCTAVTRIFVHESQQDAFVKLLVEEARKLRIGDPLAKTTDMGPLVSAKQRERIEAYVKSGIDQGAKLIFGGKRPANLTKGYYFEPTIFTDVVQETMQICREEIFGPVLTVDTYSTVEEAVRKSNDVVYGLAASVWGSNITNCFKVANALKFGTVWINEHGILTSEMPHGGYKQSGFGKDLSMYSFDDYTIIKHVYVDMTGMYRKPWYEVVHGAE